VQRGVEVVPEGAADVGEGVDADGVDLGGLDPPHRVLDEVLGDERILLVHVACRRRTSRG
jgi:hypothetical protein